MTSRVDGVSFRKGAIWQKKSWMVANTWRIYWLRQIRVFVAPKNIMGRDGLRAIIRAGLHFGGTVGVRAGWPLFSLRLGETGYIFGTGGCNHAWGSPGFWISETIVRSLGTQLLRAHFFNRNIAAFETALNMGGTFCAATHYWELPVQSKNVGDPPVGEHLHRIIEMARTNPQVKWRSVGDVVCNSPLIL